MEYNTRDSFLVAAFKVVQQYDPETYERMQSADWEVSTDPFDVFGLYTIGLIEQLNSAFGTTVAEGNGFFPNARTFMNEDNMERWANENSVNVTLFSADILVHEFKHVYQQAGEVDPHVNEPPAFDASTAFAKRLPGRDGRKIAENSEHTKSVVLSQ